MFRRAFSKEVTDRQTHACTCTRTRAHARTHTPPWIWMVSDHVMELGLCKWLSNEMKVVNPKQGQAELRCQSELRQNAWAEVRIPNPTLMSRSGRNQTRSKAAVCRTIRPRRSPRAAMKVEGEVSLTGLDSPEGLQGIPQLCLHCSGRQDARQGPSI